MKKFVIMLIAMMLLLTVSACTKNDKNSETPVSLVIIAGRHANANMFTEDMLDVARQLVERTIVKTQDDEGIHAEADVSIIVCDGDPEKVPVKAGDIDLLKIDADNEKQYAERDGWIAELVARFLMQDALKADDPEVDLLKAISQAQDILNSKKGTEHHILILDTGITTSGYLNMKVTDFINTETADVIETIREGIPNLNGTKVTFLGIGNVSSFQPELTSNTDREKLLTLWTSTIETAKGELTEELYFSENSGEPMEFSEDDENGYPYVGTVFFKQPDGTVELGSIVIEQETEPVGPGIGVAFQTSDLGFDSNKATFKDINQARHAINAIRDQIQRFLNETDDKIYIVGSVAKTASSANDTFTNKLSTDRAQAVADLLINEYGVPADRIVFFGAGIHEFSWRNANEDKGPQQANRVVAIISGNSTELIQELIRGGYGKFIK